MPVTLATLEDIPQLNALINSAYRGESSKKGWTTEADLLGGIRTDEETLTDTLQKQNSVLLKYTNDNHELLGCVNLQEEKGKLYLGMLTVAPEMQGAGIGKILLSAAETYALNKGLPAIFMTVISERKELIEWYERHGYKKTGEKKPFPMNDPKFGLPKKPLEFIVLEKYL